MFEINGKYNSCKVFTDNCDNETISQLTNLLNQEFVSGSQIRIMPDCLPNYTEILTLGGFVPLNKLSPDMRIANYDAVTKRVFFDEPKNIIARPLREGEKMYRFHCKSLNFQFSATENHRILMKGGTYLAKDIPAQTVLSDYIYTGSGIDERQQLDKYTDVEVQLICWIVGDGDIHNNLNHKTGYKDTIRIRFGLKKQRKIQRIIELLQAGNYDYNIYIDKREVTNITLTADSSKRLLDLLQYKKEYPLDFILLNDKQRTLFINECIQVDGDYMAYIKNRGYRLNSKRKNDIDLLQAIICINGGLCRAQTHYSLNNNFTNKPHEMQYLTRIDPVRLAYSKSGLHNAKIIKYEEPYFDKVYCVECTSSYFIARQNGLSFITGNCHAGKGCVIGTTMTLTDKVCPNLVGVDIGCGMYALKLKETSIDLNMLDMAIRQYVPSGFDIRDEAIASSDVADIIADIDVDRAMKSLGTLGGGNHFIEVDKASDGSLWLVIHTGSRHLGIEVCDYYQNLAYKRLTEEAAGGDIHTLTKELVEKLTREGRQKEISKAITALKNEYKAKHPDVPFELAYVKGQDFKDYIHDMKLAQTHALINRETIAKVITKRMDLHVAESFQTIHNYIDIENMILRKGSVSAQAGEKLIIPMNMRDGSLICVGKGNPDWNYSAPHGAGRLMSRAKAKESISMEDYKKSMEGIFTTCVNTSTVDESAFAYKPMGEIMENIKETVDVVDVIKPIYNFKASE